MNTVRLKTLIALFIFIFPSSAGSQQTSIIDSLLRLKPSLVEVNAINAATVNTPHNRAYFKDPNTGKILVVDRGRKVASFERNGAGVILTTNGVIVTNAHVVGNAQSVKVLLANGKKINAAVVRYAPDLDIALLKINWPEKLRAAPIADSALIRLNQEIFTLGTSPLLKESLTGGRITGLASSRNGNYSNAYESDFFETSMDIYRGDSGGPLFNRNGELVGLMTAKLLSQGHSSFAVSSNKIRRYLIAYLREAQVTHATAE